MWLPRFGFVFLIWFVVSPAGPPGGHRRPGKSHGEPWGPRGLPEPPAARFRKLHTGIVGARGHGGGNRVSPQPFWPQFGCFPVSARRASPSGMQCAVCARRERFGWKRRRAIVHRPSGWRFECCQPCWNSAYRAVSKLELTGYLDSPCNRHIVNTECSEEVRRRVAMNNNLSLEDLTF